MGVSCLHGQRGKAVRDVIVESPHADTAAAEHISQQVRFAESVQRRRVRVDSIAQFLEATALTPATDWQPDALRQVLDRCSDKVLRGSHQCSPPRCRERDASILAVRGRSCWKLCIYCTSRYCRGRCRCLRARQDCRVSSEAVLRGRVSLCEAMRDVADVRVRCAALLRTAPSQSFRVLALTLGYVCAGTQGDAAVRCWRWECDPHHHAAGRLPRADQHAGVARRVSRLRPHLPDLRVRRRPQHRNGNGVDGGGAVGSGRRRGAAVQSRCRCERPK